MEVKEKQVTVDQFNKFFTEKYGYLVNNSKKIAHKQNDKYNTGIVDSVTKDCMHDAYIKIINRLERKPFYGNITGFTIISINNTIKTHYSSVKNDKHLDYQDDSLQNMIENILIDNDEDNKRKQDYYYNLEVLTSNIFKYIEQRYDDKQVYIFKMYYLNKKMTYNKVSQTTNYSLGYISETIKGIKIDLKNNFIDWYIENGNY